MRQVAFSSTIVSGRPFAQHFGYRNQNPKFVRRLPSKGE
jgi:hypothetical protein